MTKFSGAKPYFFRSLRINFSAAALFRLVWTTTSRTSPSLSRRATALARWRLLLVNRVICRRLPFVKSASYAGAHRPKTSKSLILGERDNACGREARKI